MAAYYIAAAGAGRQKRAASWRDRQVRVWPVLPWPVW